MFQVLMNSARSRWLTAWLGFGKLPQQIEILERQREIELAQKKWRRDLKLWRTWLEGRRVGEAKEQLNRIKDPAAVPGLGEMLSRESSADVRQNSRVRSRSGW